MINIRFHIQEDIASSVYKIYVFGTGSDYKTYNIYVEGENLVHAQIEEGAEGKPFLVIPSRLGVFNPKLFFEAMTEGLKDAGFVAQVDEKERIVAEALSQERKDELEYHKKRWVVPIIYV